jgi:nitroimidazol reductase NimA-like FMN-containing flavoprotein (pyridoxamine 5'-phosphate oxidase superfamily)
MPPEFPADKKELIEALLAQPVLVRLATTNPKTCQPHVVPVWFLWDGEFIWISAFSSTRKVRDLELNPRCAVLIEPEKTDKLQGVLFEGQVELISQPLELVSETSIRIYTLYMGVEGAQAAEPQSWAVDPENRLLKLTPSHIAAW